MTVRKGYVDTDEGQLHYRRTADARSGAPTVLLLHQNPASSALFEPAIELFGDRFDAIAPDLPGFGGSPPLDDEPTVPAYAGVVADALADLGVDRTHAVGHHTGASVAVALPAESSVTVQSVTAVGPPYLTPDERQERLEKLDGDYFPPLDEAGEYLREHWDFFADETDDLAIRHQLTVDALLGRGSALATYRAVWNHDFRAAFDALPVPRMLMAAQGDALWDGFERAREANPDVPAVELSGGNCEPLLDAERFATEVGSFVDGVERE